MAERRSANKMVQMRSKKSTGIRPCQLALKRIARDLFSQPWFCIICQLSQHLTRLPIDDVEATKE